MLNMGKLSILIYILTICTYNADGSPLSQRIKRFILQPDSVTTNPAIPTTFPTPALPNPKNPSSYRRSQPLPTASFTFINNSIVQCPHKRSTDYQRVLLSDDTLQERYLELIGDIDRNIFAKNLDEAEANFRHMLIPPMKQAKHWHHRNKPKKSEFTSDLHKFQSWYEAVLEDIATSNKTLENETAHIDDILENILSEIGITKVQLQQVLDLKHDIDELKQFRITKQRIKRDTIGAIRSEQAYCTQRGKPTGTPYLRLCSACAMTTQFPDDMFPRYTNEITCDSSDCDCMQATKNIVFGKCQPIIKNVLMLKRKKGGCRMVIRNGQTVYDDEWEIYQQPLHVGCECMIKKISSLSDLVPRH